MKLVTIKFKSGGLHEKHVVANYTMWNLFGGCMYSQDSAMLLFLVYW